MFSKLDANSGFWQIPLAQSSRELTTFLTPFGRYCFNKLPFGISSAPEHFQKRMSRILAGLEWTLCLMDDVLIWGKDEKEHHERLIHVAALERIEKAGATLNPEKCEFAKTEIKFLGHLITQNGIQADPEKTTVIAKLKPPENITELRRFLGMVNQRGKFSQNLAQLTQPLRELLSKRSIWTWGPAQESAFSAVKNEFSRPQVLAPYNPSAETKISAGASSFGLGAVDRAMTDTEHRYAQIEKEALAATWACKKFSRYMYVLGMKFTLETDHKLLVPLLSTKQLDSLPPRVLRFRLRMDRYDYKVQHVPGKALNTADTLSRAPLELEEADQKLLEEAESLTEISVSNLPASKDRLDDYRRHQSSDPVCSMVMKFCQHGWPEKGSVSQEIKAYWRERGALTTCKELLSYGNRIVVPKSLQKETPQKLHQGHQGIQRSRLRARHSVWWPSLSQEITNLVKNCRICAKTAVYHHEPMIASELPQYPWQKIATDLFILRGVNYLIIVDYFSRFPKVIRLFSTTASAVIQALKSVFSRHGIPETVVSDNRTQYSSHQFREFAREYDFCHITSSPYYPQSNGLAERSVKTVKQLISKSKDLYLSLLSYRTTPFPWCGYSPAELSMGRQLRTTIPQVSEHLVPDWTYLETFRQSNRTFKEKQKLNHDRHHRAKELLPIPADSHVWITPGDSPVPGRVVSRAETPRSYQVTTPHGVTRRNRRHLIVQPAEEAQPDEAPLTKRDIPSPNRIMTRTQTGTAVRPPERL